MDIAVEINIVLIDDDDVANFINKKLLSAYKFKSITAFNDPLEAISKINELCPNLILLDINMPKMDGFEVLQHLQEAGLCASTSVFMLTSSNRESDSEKALLFKQVKGYLEKPLNKEKIGKLISDYNAKPIC